MDVNGAETIEFYLINNNSSRQHFNQFLWLVVVEFESVEQIFKQMEWVRGREVHQ